MGNIGIVLFFANFKPYENKASINTQEIVFSVTVAQRGRVVAQRGTVERGRMVQWNNGTKGYSGTVEQLYGDTKGYSGPLAHRGTVLP